VPATAVETALPTPAPEPKRPVSRAAKLGPEERRLFDANVLGFFTSSDRQGLIVVVEFRQPANLSGISSAQFLSATDEAGRSVAALAGTEAEIRRTGTDDPTGAMRVRLFVRGENAAVASGDLRTVQVQLGPATIRARYDKALFSR
jgi:hypothetical protein